MENMKPNILETENMNDTDSIDINKEITEFLSFLKNNDNNQMLLKLSEIELQNEKEFKNRAEKILKHHHSQDQIIFEEKLMTEQQKNINVITSDLESEIDKEKLEPTHIAKIYQSMLILKISNINDTKHVKDLEDFIKINKINLKYMSKIKIKIKSILNKLSPKSDSPKKSDKKITHAIKKHATWNKSCSNASRRNTRENTTQIQPRTYMEHIRRFRNYEDMGSHDSSTADDDFVEHCSLSSTANLSKDHEETNSGNVHLILNPFDT